MDKSNFILTSVPIDELRTIIQECVKSELQNFKPEIPPDDDLIDSKEACNILGISLVTLHFWRKDGKVRFYSIGTRIRFKKKELMEDLQTTKRYKR